MAGYSKSPLLAKLGLKPCMKAVFVAMPESILAALAPLPAGITVLKKPGTDMDYIHCFADSEAELKRIFPAMKRALKKEGMLWISWKKGRKPPDLTETTVRTIALRSGLVDVKVCAVDEVWSGLKLVYRSLDR